MSSAQFGNCQILDCTLRDGGYLNNWQFDKKLVRQIYRALSKSGVDFVEIGYRDKRNDAGTPTSGIWRYSSEEDIREVAGNISGAKIALMADYGKIDPDDFCQAEESLIKLIRIAAHRDVLDKALELLRQIKRKGYQVSLNAVGYSNYTEDERQELIKLLKTASIDYLYIVDSYGSLFPHQIRPILEPILASLGCKVGFHSHNNLQMAFANTLEAIRSGAQIVDATIYGMGRAAGNLPTEVLISYLEKERGARYNSVPLLNIIDKYFIALQKENNWGYQLPYMLSGMFQCHPNYAKSLVDFREYTIEDIWKALGYIRKNHTVGFSQSLLESMMQSNIIANPEKTTLREPAAGFKGRASCADSSTRANIAYLDRHKDRFFLILANGPTLKEYKDKIDQFIEKYNPLILGANYLGGLFKPDYHAFSNKRRFTAYIDSVAFESKLLIGQHIPEEMIREYTDRDYERIYYIDQLNADFGISEGVITTNCRTISVLLVAVAIVMGAKRIFCAGLDGYAGLTEGHFHFYNEKEEKQDRQMIEQRHLWCQNFLQQIDEYLNQRGAEGIHILTPTSYRFCYKGIENYI